VSGTAWLTKREGRTIKDSMASNRIAGLMGSHDSLVRLIDELDVDLGGSSGTASGIDFTRCGLQTSDEIENTRLVLVKASKRGDVGADRGLPSGGVPG